MPTNMRIVALIVAAGDSRRMETPLPKPYLPLAGMAVLRHSATRFLAHPSIAGVRVVIRREDHAHYKRATEGLEGLSLFPCVIGGARRQDSVRKGLEALIEHTPTHVLIHDAARPLLSDALITRVVDALADAPAVLPTLPITDTLKRLTPTGLTTVDRDALFAAQTPQGFAYDPILALHRAYAAESVTDDIALAERGGLRIECVEGEPWNVKLTSHNDLTLAHRYLA